MASVARRRPGTITVDDLPWASADKKPAKNSLHQRLQQELDNLLKEPQVDWQRVRDLMCHADALDPNYTDPSSLVATIHRCAYEGGAELLRWCLDRGADVDAQTAIGRSALHCACNGNKPGCIRLLLERGADINLCSLSGQTPLHICCMYNSYEAVLELLHGTSVVIDIDAEDSKRLKAENLTKDRQILRAIRKYRATFDERRQADLIEQALTRIGRLGDGRDGSSGMPKKLAECQATVLQRFPGGGQERSGETPRSAGQSCGGAVSGSSGQDAVAPPAGQQPSKLAAVADKSCDGRIEWSELREKHLSQIGAQAVDCKQLMQHLSDLESAIFRESVRTECGGAGTSKTQGVTPRASAMALKHASRPLLFGARAVMGAGLKGVAVAH